MIQSGFLEENSKVLQLRKKDMVGFVQRTGTGIISQAFRTHQISLHMITRVQRRAQDQGMLGQSRAEEFLYRLS